MIRDLIDAGEVQAQADVLVVGGGTAGLTIAAQLAMRGLKVVCLESGGHVQEADEHPLNEVVQARSVYQGAMHGRFRTLGGTSTRWGGALIPFQRQDLDGHDWAVPFDEIVAFQSCVERFFDLPAGTYDPEEPLDVPGFVARLAKWPSFARRNVANLLAKSIESPAGPEIWINATATTFEVRDGSLRTVVAQAPDGASIRIAAGQVVIASGAIESTRLVLLLDRQNGSRIVAQDDQIGRYFSDHLSVVVADLDVHDRKALNRLIGFRFAAGGAMRNLRLELAPSTPYRATVKPCFAHVGFVEETGTGFDALRTLLRFFQQRRVPAISTFGRLAVAAPWLARAAWWRFAEKRLLFPAGAGLQVHMVIEQQPVGDNRITLSTERTDRFGNPLAVIDWAPTPADVVNLTKSVDALEAGWRQSDLAHLARFVRRPEGEAEAELAQGGGIYHPGGSTRMGRDPATAVVDADLTLFRCPNVSVVATSVLPNGGGSNPTMMLMMLAFRCADRLATLVAARVRAEA